MGGVIKKTLKNKIRKEPSMNLYKKNVDPTTLLCGSEICGTSKRDDQRIQATEMSVEGRKHRNKVNIETLKESGVLITQVKQVLITGFIGKYHLEKFRIFQMV